MSRGHLPAPVASGRHRRSLKVRHADMDLSGVLLVIVTSDLVVTRSASS